MHRQGEHPQPTRTHHTHNTDIVDWILSLIEIQLGSLLIGHTLNPSQPSSRPIATPLGALSNMPAATPTKPLPGAKYGPAILAVASCKFDISLQEI